MRLFELYLHEKQLKTKSSNIKNGSELMREEYDIDSLNPRRNPYAKALNEEKNDYP